MLLIVAIKPAMVNNNKAPTRKVAWMLTEVVISIKAKGPRKPPTSMKVRCSPMEMPRNSGFTMSESKIVRVTDTIPDPKPSTTPMAKRNSKELKAV